MGKLSVTSFQGSFFVCSLGGSCQELTGRVQPGVWRTSHRACLSCLCVYLPGFWRKCSTPKIWREPPQKYRHSKQVRSTARSSTSNDFKKKFPHFFEKCITVSSRLLDQHIGETAESPLLDPCLPTDLQDEIGPSTQRLHLRGTGDFDLCRQILQPFLNRTNETQTSLSGIYQPAIDYSNSQFYGFSEFYYCTEDVLRMGGDYNASKYARAAKVNTMKGIHICSHDTWPL